MRKFQRTIGLAGLYITLASADTAAAQQPFFMGLGHLPNGSFYAEATELWGVSADGTVVVGASGGESFRWTRETGMIGLGTPEPSFPKVSADGTTIVGNLSLDILYRWTSETGVVPLPIPRSGYRSILVSGDGSILIVNFLDPNGIQKAARWTSARGLQSLPLSGDFYASALSADGLVIGGSAQGIGGYIWSAANGIVPVALGFSPILLSTDGEVAAGHTGLFADFRGQRWTQETGAVDLGRLPDGLWMSVTGMTSDGSIVVGNTRNVNQTRPAIWDAIHGPRYLDDILLDQFGQAMSGWSQFRAQGISGDGRSIIGRGVNPDGNTEAWIAYLGPAPTIPGDFNNDGAVDAADYVAWRDGRGTRYTQGDYEAWRAHFGQTAVLSAAAGLPRSENPAVPEPYTFAIAAFGLVQNIVRQRSHRRRPSTKFLAVATA